MTSTHRPARRGPRASVLAAALAAGAAMAAPAAALDLSKMSADESAAFGAAVRSYLLENPEVLVEVIGVLEQREAEARVAADAAMLAENAEALFENPTAWVGGNPEGDVTIVEFVDYRCSFCRQAHPEVEELIASDGDIRFIVKEFPILGEQSVLASRFALAARAVEGDDAYKAAHDALITFRGDITPEALGRLADALAFDAGAVMAEMESPEITDIIDANRALAQRLAITGTPTFVLGEEMVRGYLPLAEMQAVVAEQRAE